MGERIIEIGLTDPVKLYGVNDAKLTFIRQYFPKLKIVARGNAIKVIGEDSDIDKLEIAIQLFIEHLNKYDTLTESNIERLMDSEQAEQVMKGNENGKDVIVYGNGGLVVKAKTANQRKLVESCNNKDMVFVIGPAGTGKTYTAVAMAVRALKEKEVRKIILTRPAVEAGENLGFLPGDLKEKLDPYLQPLYDALYDMIPPEKLKSYLENHIIEIAPLAFMRGRTLDHAFVILDEAQNATESQLKMFLTRMGASAKFVITGDLTQVDLPKHQPSGLLQATKVLKEVEEIGFVELDEKDVIRHNLVKSIVKAYDKLK